MNIDHPLRETVRKRFAENAHKARQHDQIDLVLPHQRRQRVLIGRLIRKILSPHDLRRNTARRGARQSVSVAAACDHQRNLAARQLARLLRVKQRL